MATDSSAPEAPVPTAEQQAILRRIEGAAKLFDAQIGLPGGIRVGLDGLVGLIPAAGDLIMGISAVYIVREAAKLGLAKGTIPKMLFNILLDLLIGAIPLAGDIFDFFFQCNVKNVNLVRSEFGMAPIDFKKPSKPAR